MIIFLYGEDSFRSSQKILEIKEKFLKYDQSGSGLSIFDYEEGDFKTKLLDVLELPNLLSPKRLVIFKNLIFAGTEEEQKEVLNYLKKNNSLVEDKDLVVVFSENSLPKKTNALFKILDKNAKSQNFEKMAGVKLDQWVLKRMKELDPKASISRTALEKLVAYSGGDTHMLNSEMQKLANFAGEKMIGDSDVDEIVNSNFNFNIFNTIDALGSNNKKEAARLLHEHLKRGEDPFYIFSMFVYQFRNLLKVADVKENQGVGEYEITKITHLHPFVVKKSLAQIRNFSQTGQALDKLKNIYQELSELDTKIKTGKIDIRLALDKFIVGL
jgi:DNA polymerase III delta subunit